MITRLTESDYFIDKNTGSVWIEAAGYVVRLRVTQSGDLHVSTFINGNEEGAPLSDVLLPNAEI